MTSISLGFALKPLLIPLGQILPSRKMPAALDTSRKFKQIRTSIEEIGLIEPLSVTSIIRKTGQHMLLDGHIRLIALREIVYDESPCLVATEDVSYS